MKNNRPEIVIAGVMTGTSCDGVDIASMAFRRERGELVSEWIGSETYSYPKRLRERVLEAQIPNFQTSLRTLLLLEREFGHLMATVLRDYSGKARRRKIDAFAVHGQTIAHHPKPTRAQSARQVGGESLPGVTLQICSPEMVAAATDKTIISNFRDGDLCVGGQGAPLVPLFHRIWATENKPRLPWRRGVIVQNIGGIANFTYIGRDGKLIASDSGPGNALIDWSVQLATQGKRSFDRDGEIAAGNPVSSKLLKALLKHPYFKRPFPKSTGRDDFSIAWAQALLNDIGAISGGELVSTITQLTAQTILGAYEAILKNPTTQVDRVILCGGGAKNLELARRIAEGLKDSQIALSSLDGKKGGPHDPQMMEAQAFAYFGMLSLLGRPLGGEWTGAKKFGSPGRITPGKNFSELQLKLHSAKFFDSR
jgi:anhydro-N-acetylmuramic acid kinase